MSSKRGALVGAQRPRVSHLPRFSSSDVEDAAFLAGSYGMPPDPWQYHVLETWLARRPDDKWAAGRCGLAVPRQNGKNGAIEIRELFGTIVLGEKILHTAHEVKTARKAFIRLKYFFGERAKDTSAKFPELNALVKEIRSTNGQEAIVLHNGGSIEFVARSRGSGRGYTVDVLILDEAQELTDEQLEALQFTISSAPLGNPQTILAGTPPSPFSQGEVFTRTREAALGGKAKRLAWHEWSIEGDVNVFDRKNWAAANPSLGIRLQEMAIEDELPPSMSIDGFCRERLGRWLEKGVKSGPFPPDSWQAGVDINSQIPPEEHVSYCVDVSADRTMAHIGVAGYRNDGLPHIEIAATRAGVDWIAPWLAERTPINVVIQARGAPASPLIDELTAQDGVNVIEWGGPDLGTGTAKLFDLVRDSLSTNENAPPKGVRHLPQPVLDIAAASAVPRILTDGGMAWDRRKSPVDIAPLVAVTGALWHLTQPREPEPRSAYEDHDLLIL